MSRDARLQIPSFDLALTDQLAFILGLGGAVAAALVGGAIAVRLRQPAIVGYLLAGVVIGPFTPGSSATSSRSRSSPTSASSAAVRAGRRVLGPRAPRCRRLALPGGVLQIVIILARGCRGRHRRWPRLQEALVVGACLSISSTLVVLKSLMDRGEIDSLHGRAAVGWSIVQDLATIMFIVTLPTLAGGEALGPLALALGKAVVFLVLAYVRRDSAPALAVPERVRAGIERAVPVDGLRDGAADGVRLERDLRPVAGSRRLRRRDRRFRVGPVAPGGRPRSSRSVTSSRSSSSCPSACWSTRPRSSRTPRSSRSSWSSRSPARAQSSPSSAARSGCRSAPRSSSEEPWPRWASSASSWPRRPSGWR